MRRLLHFFGLHQYVVCWKAIDIETGKVVGYRYNGYKIGEKSLRYDIVRKCIICGKVKEL